MNIKFGRNPMSYDARDFRMTDFLSLEKRALALASTQKLWTLRTILDQRDTPHCVGFAWANYGNCEPVVDSFTDADGDRIYYAAKIIDKQPNEENGSTTRSGVKAMKKEGRVATYAFANDLEGIIQWLLVNGPVVTGSLWYEDMLEVDSKGFVKPTGRIVGGHEYLILGVDTVSGVFTFANSWGEDWGKKGFFYMWIEDYQKLFNLQGDACVAMELPLIPKPVPIVEGWTISAQTDSQIILTKK